MNGKSTIFKQLAKAAFAIAAATALLIPTTTKAGGNSDEPFDAGAMIMHHVLDAHEIHIVGDFGIYLPVILLDDGIVVFSSNDLYHGVEKTITIDGKEENYFSANGYSFMHEHVYKGETLTTEMVEGESHITNGHPLDFSITKNVVGMLLGGLLLILIMTQVAKGYKKNEGKAPNGIQNLIEPFVLFVRDEVAKPSIGHKYAYYMPYLLTVFFFIWIGNLIGLIPFLGGINFTGNIAVTLVLATFTFIITSYRANSGYWKHIVSPPGVPAALLPIMLPIEIIGVFSKPIVLMLRLFANITAGHIILLAFTSLIFIFAETYGAAGGLGVSVVSVAFSIFMTFLELLVAFLQAYVFTLLSALYFGMATEEAHH
ncbi:MAG: F0F1 ATP synthase subunit A [Salibacteraceae bacterium]